MCNFCNTDLNSMTRSYKGYDYSPTVIIEKVYDFKNKVNYFCLLAIGEDSTRFKIEYCPICGQKLESK